MANHASALKRHRRDEKRRVHNHQLKSRLRTKVRRFRRMLAEEDVDGAKAAISETLSVVDRSAKLGVIHDNTAARTKSRLQTALKKLAAGA